MKYLFFDTETTGLPRVWNAVVEEVDNWPRVVQIAWEMYEDGEKIAGNDFIIKPEGFEIPLESSKIHGITTARAKKEGVELMGVLDEFWKLANSADFLVAHNISFDEKIIGAEFLRKDMPNCLAGKKTICTKEISTGFCALPSANGYAGYKWPKLSELHTKLFGCDFEDSHNAKSDVKATAKCFWEMRKKGVV
jgi:DNA polymerase III subunit epsilon